MTTEELDNLLTPMRLMLAYLSIATEKQASLEGKVEILSRFGLNNKEIAQVCASRIQSIRNARHTLSKNAKKQKKAK